MGERWNPWRALRARPDVRLEWRNLPGDLFGTVEPDGAGWVVVLDPCMDRVTRRCILGHELVHVERGIVAGPARSMEREEVIVARETARRLVPADELDGLIGRRVSIGAGLTARDVAEVFDMTSDVAEAAMRLRAMRENVAWRSAI